MKGGFDCVCDEIAWNMAILPLISPDKRDPTRALRRRYRSGYRCIDCDKCGKLNSMDVITVRIQNRELFSKPFHPGIPSQVLHVNNDTLRVLDVENPRMFSLQGEHCTHLGKMLRVNPSLSEIYFGKFRFRDLSIELFLDDVGHDQSRLRVLDLRCNEIGATGATHIAELVRGKQD